MPFPAKKPVLPVEPDEDELPVLPPAAKAAPAAKKLPPKGKRPIPGSAKPMWKKIAEEMAAKV
jgi:hypothetical protein